MQLNTNIEGVLIYTEKRYVKVIATIDSKSNVALDFATVDEVLDYFKIDCIEQLTAIMVMQSSLRI